MIEQIKQTNRGQFNVEGSLQVRTERQCRNQSCAKAILAMPEHGQDARSTKSSRAAKNRRISNTGDAPTGAERKPMVSWAVLLDEAVKKPAPRFIWWKLLCTCRI